MRAPTSPTSLISWPRCAARLVLAGALAAAPACGGGGGAAPRPVVTGPAVDEDTAARDARGVVGEIYAAIAAGKPDNLFSVLDEALVVFGPRRADAPRTRTDALVALRELVTPDERTKLRAGGVTAVASRGGRSAWAADVATLDGQAVGALAILTSDDEFFRVTTASVARMPAARQLRAELGKAAIVPPAAAAAAGVPDAARAAVERFQRGLTDPAVWGEDLAGSPDAVVIGPTSGALARGAKAIKKLWKRRVTAQTRAALAGEITAGATSDGQLAWVTAPVTQIATDEDPLPLRAFAVFERTKGGWRLCALHEAVAVDEAGAGAPFMKAAPPPAPPPEEATPPPKGKGKGKERDRGKSKRRRGD